MGEGWLVLLLNLIIILSIPPMYTLYCLLSLNLLTIARPIFWPASLRLQALKFQWNRVKFSCDYTSKHSKHLISQIFQLIQTFC